MGWLLGLSVYRWVAIGVVVLALLAALGFDHAHTIPKLEGELAAEKTGRAEDAAEANAQAVAQAADFRKREHTWQTTLNGAVDDGNKREAAAIASRDAVTRERDRLRASNTSLLAAARRTPSGAIAPAECAPAIAAADLLGGMFDRVSAAAAELAAYGDAAANASRVCSAAWPVNPPTVAPSQVAEAE